MRMNLTAREYIQYIQYIQYTEYTIHLRDYFTCKFDKIIMFHGTSKGDIFVNKLTLYKYYLLGYKFICCYPEKVRQKLGFGQFIWPEHDYYTTSNGTVDNNGFQMDVDITLKNNE